MDFCCCLKSNVINCVDKYFNAGSKSNCVCSMFTESLTSEVKPKKKKKWSYTMTSRPFFKKKLFVNA